MVATTTLDEKTKSPLDGSEFLRLATETENWKTTLNDLFSDPSSKQDIVSGPGFVYLRTCNGEPTEIPTEYADRVPMIYDTSKQKLYFFVNGSWSKL